MFWKKALLYPKTYAKMCEERGAHGSAANLCNKRMANKHIANKQIGFSVSANLLIESRYSISILDISFDDRW